MEQKKTNENWDWSRLHIHHYHSLRIWLRFCDFISILYGGFSMCRLRLLCNDFNVVICLLNFIAGPPHKMLSRWNSVSFSVIMSLAGCRTNVFNLIVFSKPRVVSNRADNKKGNNNKYWNVFRIQRFHYVLTVHRVTFVVWYIAKAMWPSANWQKSPFHVT